MVKFLKSLFTKNKEVTAESLVSSDYRLYALGGVWGNTINWHGKYNSISPTQQVVGFKEFRPSKGDLLKATMESGKVALWVFTEVELSSDPHDMFFGTVQVLDYAEKLNWFEDKPEPRFSFSSYQR